MNRMNTFHRALHASLVAAALTLAGVAHAQTAPAELGLSLAATSGCLNCDGTAPRGDAPSFLHMQERAAGREGERDALARHWMQEMRATGSGWRAIVAHRQVTDSTAGALFRWLGTPPTKPVN